jgi:hypothetical protein
MSATTKHVDAVAAKTQRRIKTLRAKVGRMPALERDSNPIPAKDHGFSSQKKKGAFAPLTVTTLGNQAALRDWRLEGTLAPFCRAFDKPMAIACLRFFTGCLPDFM